MQISLWKKPFVERIFEFVCKVQQWKMSICHTDGMVHKVYDLNYTVGKNQLASETIK